MRRWWHRVILQHEQIPRKVTVPMWDRTSRGILVRCSCGEDWAL